MSDHSDDTDQEAQEEKAKARKSAEFGRMLEESLRGGGAGKFKVGDKLRCEILVAGKDEIFVSTGKFSDASVARREFLDELGNFPYKVGEAVDLYVTQVRGANVSLSPKPTHKNLAEDLEDAFDMMLPVEGRIVEVCKGGVRVSIKGKLAFCPISQIDVKRVENPEEYVGQRFDFRVTEFKEGGRNIVVSRRKYLEEQRELGLAAIDEAPAGPILGGHQVGDIVTGKVAKIEKFGAFVELAPGIDGLAHVSELSWKRVGHPEEVVKLGQEVSVKILKIENQDGRVRVSLSLKQAGGDPWAKVAEKFPVGTAVTGKVERREPYGLFVRIDDGITGLLPKSKANEHPEFPFEKLKVGDDVTVQIGELRLEERRISLTVPRDPGSDDWKGYMAAQNAGALGSFGGSLGDKLRQAMDKKKKP